MRTKTNLNRYIGTHFSDAISTDIIGLADSEQHDRTVVVIRFRVSGKTGNTAGVSQVRVDRLCFTNKKNQPQISLRCYIANSKFQLRRKTNLVFFRFSFCYIFFSVANGRAFERKVRRCESLYRPLIGAWFACDGVCWAVRLRCKRRTNAPSRCAIRFVRICCDVSRYLRFVSLFFVSVD